MPGGRPFFVIGGTTGAVEGLDGAGEVRNWGIGISLEGDSSI